MSPREDGVADPIAVVLRFNGEADDLFERFERARRLWIEAQDADHTPPAFYAACKTDDGIVIVTGWQTDAAHKAFGRTMSSCLELVGMGPPDHHEHLAIQRLGWDPIRAEAS
jgi:hypothetical protein